MKSEISIGSKPIGDDHPTFIIAEAGVNHNGNLKIALELVKKAKRVGADCVKFQTFKADRIVTKSSPKAEYQLGTTDKDESQFAMLKKLELLMMIISTFWKSVKNRISSFFLHPTARKMPFFWINWV